MISTNIIIKKLKLFPKPDLSNKSDLECGVCYDKLETGECIGLPCSCANSIYHLECISNFLSYEYERNFCPYCRKKYELPTNAEIEKEESDEYDKYSKHSRSFTRNKDLKIFLLFIHCIFNCILNLSCLTILNPNNPSGNLMIIPSLGFLFNFIQCGVFAKIFLNVFIFALSARQTDKAYYDGLIGSNISQLLLLAGIMNCRIYDFLPYKYYQMILLGHIGFFAFDTLLRFCIEKFIM